MTLKHRCAWISVIFFFAWTCLAGESARPPRVDGVFASHPAEAEEQAGTDTAFQAGQKAIKESRWDKAIEAFDEAIQQKSSRADGALYWKAYAQDRAGQREGALQTLQVLSGSFPKSSWLGDAKALEIEIRGRMGQPVSPETQVDDELRLMALNSLISSDPERALPILQKTLQGNSSPKIKEKALFVLAQSGSAPARDLLVQIARGAAYPELQSKALNYLALFGGKQSRQTLEEIYRSSTDVKVKRQILHGYMIGGDRDRLLALAKDEKEGELQRDAVQQLGVLGARAELWNLYQAGSGTDLKAAILQALFVGGDTDKLIELARTEKDPKLRIQAIRLLGVSPGPKTGDVLVSLYQSETDPSIRRKAIEGLFIQGNANALIQLARKESNPEMKKDLVSKLALMKSKEALDYMMEILNK